MKELIYRIAASATGGDSQISIEEAMSSYSSMGYKMFELYMAGRGSSVKLQNGVEYYQNLAKKYDMRYPSLHLDYIEEDLGETFDYAVECALFAEKLNIPVVVFNTTKKSHYVRALQLFLEATKGHNITPIVQIHEGRAIDTMDDVKEVLERVNDPRVKVLHEVGSFHVRGNSWKEVCDTFGERIGLVHLKDMKGRGKKSAPFGTGEIDIPGLFKEMDRLGYQGDYVVEMDPVDRENTNKYIGEALQYILKNCT